jgi:hypothetical protein
VPPAWLAREQPNPPTRGLARWEVVLRLHARYASRTGLVNDYTLSALAAARVFHDRNGSLTAETPQAGGLRPLSCCYLAVARTMDRCVHPAVDSSPLSLGCGAWGPFGGED